MAKPNLPVDRVDSPQWPEMDVTAICRSCGACCSYSADWPRFSLEDDTALARIPAELVNAAGSGMRCRSDRCAALEGEVGRSTACAIYEVRPDVCRACLPGDDACVAARQRFDLPPPPSSSTIDQS